MFEVELLMKDMKMRRPMIRPAPAHVVHESYHEISPASDANQDDELLNCPSKLLTALTMSKGNGIMAVGEHDLTPPRSLALHRYWVSTFELPMSWYMQVTLGRLALTPLSSSISLALSDHSET